MVTAPPDNLFLAPDWFALKMTFTLKQFYQTTSHCACAHPLENKSTTHILRKQFVFNLLLTGVIYSSYALYERKASSCFIEHLCNKVNLRLNLAAIFHCATFEHDNKSISIL